jgi:hypothetical protein
VSTRKIRDKSKSSDAKLRLRPIEFRDNVGGSDRFANNDHGTNVAGPCLAVERLLDARVAD